MVEARITGKVYRHITSAEVHRFTDGVDPKHPAEETTQVFKAVNSAVTIQTQLSLGFPKLSVQLSFY